MRKEGALVSQFGIRTLASCSEMNDRPSAMTVPVSCPLR
jgi:hypothetical protein